MHAFVRTLLLALCAWIVLLGPACEARAVANACSDSLAGSRCPPLEEELTVVPRNVWDSLHTASFAAQDLAKQLLANATSDAHPLLHELSAKMHALAADARALANISLPADTDALFAQVKLALPTPSDTAPSHAARLAAVTSVLDAVEDVVVELAVQQGWAGPDAVRAAFRPAAQGIVDVVLFVGDFAEQHPALVAAAASMVICAVVVEVPVLQPVLMLLGWGPLGPVKNSFAAWVQSFFFGAKVPSGSLFAALQSAAMGGAAQTGANAAVCGIMGALGGAIAGLVAGSDAA